MTSSQGPSRSQFTTKQNYSPLPLLVARPPQFKESGSNYEEEIMADSSSPPSQHAAAETPAQERARLRRERLAAKNGASRLQQISALQGGPPKDLSEIQKDLPGMYRLYRQPISVGVHIRACTTLIVQVHG